VRLFSRKGFALIVVCVYFAATCFSNMPVIHTNIEEDGDAVRTEFSQFLAKLSVAMSDKRDQEELSIMNHR